MQKNKIEVSKDGTGITMYVPLSVYRAGKQGLTISYPGDTQDGFRFGTSAEQLQKFAAKLQELFAKHVEEA